MKQITIDVPGFSHEQIDIVADRGVLTVVADNGQRCLRRAYTLPVDVDPKLIEATLNLGVLTISIPHPDPIRIQVRAHNALEARL
jgi:HSP20 family molecular chaperone IbpA